MFTVCFSALASFGVAARSWCWIREPSWASTSSGTSVGDWVTKKTPTPFDRINRTVWAIESRKSARCVVEEQVRLVEEEHQLRLLDVADLGKVVEQVGQQPHQERREDRGPVLEVGQLHQGDQPLAVGRGPQEVAGLELRLAEERVRALVGERDQLAQDHPCCRAGETTEVLEVGLALVGGEVLDHLAKVGEVQQRQPGLVGVVEDQPERGLLGLVEPEHLRQQGRPERGHRHPQRDAGALAADGEVLHRETLGAPLLAHRGRALDDLRVLLAGRRQPGEVALDVRGEDRDAGGGELLGEELQGLRLAGAGRTGHETVPVEHRERDPNGYAGQGGLVQHQAAELERRTLEGVPGGHRGADRGPGPGLVPGPVLGRGRLSCRSP